jgi:hypothetical protein
MLITALIPSQSIPSLRLIQGIQVFTEGGNDALILVGILAENILQ